MASPSDFRLDPDVRKIGVSVLSGLLEARSRGLKAVLILVVVFAALTPFSSQVFHLLAQPMIDKMPAGSSLIAKQVAAPFLTPLKATFWLALFLTMPALLYQIWRLVDQFLPATARHIALPFVFASAILFYAGVAFAFFFVLPLAFAFFTHAAPRGVTVMTDINSYLDFTIWMLFAFGLAFQVPIAIIVLVWTGVVSRQTLGKGRPYVFLGAFVLGMLLTPPDMFSQTLLAVPMYLLFEGALFFCARFLRDRP